MLPPSKRDVTVACCCCHNLIVTPYPSAMQHEFDRNKWEALLAKTKSLLTKPEPEKLEFRRNRSQMHEKIRLKCQYFAINSSSAEASSRRRLNLPVYVSHILGEFRRSMLRHDWGTAKLLLRAILKSTLNHHLAWTSLTTALAHMPGSLPLLQEFLEEYKDQFFSGETINGLLTIRGLQTCKMPLGGEDNSTEGGENVVGEEWTDSEVEDSVYDDSSNLDTVSKAETTSVIVKENPHSE